MSRKRILNWIITLVFILVLIFYLRSIDWILLLEYAGKAKSIIYFTILLCFAALIIKIYRLKIIASSGNKRITTMESAFVQSSSILLAIFTPGRVGEFSKIYFLKKKGISLSYSVFSLVAERISDILVLILGSLFFIQNYVSLTAFGWVLFISLIAVVLSVFIFLFYFGERFKYFLLKKKFSFLNKQIIKNKTIKSFLSEFSFPKNRLVMVYIVIMTIFAWLIESLVSWIVLFSLDININFFVVVSIVCISTIASILSILPLGLGSLDFSYMYLMTQTSVPKEAALFTLLWLRLLIIITVFSVSATSLKFNGMSISKLKKIRVD